tara:strand:- start:168 stop:422 length:255 start_codon:yes stop_codon:yes gene_type:complete
MNDEKQMPGLAEQGRNLVNLMKDVGEDIFAGQDIFVEQFEQKRRYDICQACPSFEHSRKRCRECGCFMMNKTALRAAKCPLKKW